MRLPFLDIAVFMLLMTSVTAAVDTLSSVPIVAMNQSTYLFGGSLATSGFQINATEWNQTQSWVDPNNLINDLNANGTGVNTNDSSFIDSVGRVWNSWYQLNLAPTFSWVVSSLNVVMRAATACVALGHYLLIYMPFLPPALVWTIDGAMWVTYALGIAQLVSNRTLRPT